MQSQLFDLPLNLTIDLLRSWLSLKDLALLDTAQCNRSTRQRYVDALSSDGFILDITSYDSYKLEMTPLMQWIEDRRVKLERVDLRDGGWQKGPGQIASFLGSVGSNLLDLSADNSGGYLMTTCCIAIASCPHLKVLHLSDCNDDGTEGTVSKLIAQRATTLERLAMEDCKVSRALPENAEMMKLQYFAALDSFVSELTHLPFVRNCPNLLYFNHDDFGSSDDLLLALAECCPSLRSLHYGKAAAGSTAGLEAVLLACKDLHTVDFRSFQGFTNAHIASLVQHCQKLHTLRIQLHPTGITEECVAMLTPRLAELRHLALEGLRCAADDEPLRLLTQHCRQLRTLGLRAVEGQVVETALTKLLSALPYLEGLDLALTDLLTDETLVAIGKNCPHLNYLNMCETAGYTAKGVSAIAAGCAALENVLFSNHDGFFSELAQCLWAAFRPKLQFYTDESTIWTRWNNFRNDV